MTSPPRRDERSADRCRRRRRWTWSWRLLLLLAVTYSLLANLALSTATGRRVILPENERWTVRWGHAWSLVPGLVHFRDLDAAGHSRRVRWEVAVEWGRAWIDLSALARRRVALHQVRGSVVTCAFERSTPAVPEERSSTAEGRAPPAERRPWLLVLRGARLRDVGDCRLDRARWNGRADLRFDLSAQLPRGWMQIELRRARLIDTELFDGERIVADVHSLSASLSTPRFEPRGRSLEELLPESTGRLQLEATTANLDLLDVYLSRAPWLEIASEPGRLRLDLSFAGGRWEPGTSIHFAGDVLRLRYLDYEARGKAELSGRVENDTPTLLASFREFEVRQPDRELPHVVGEQLVVRMVGEDSQIAPPPHQRVTLDLPPTEVVDLTAYNDYLPRDAGVEIVGGRGEVEARVELSTRDASGHGEVRLSSSDLEASYGDLALEGGLELRLVLSQPDLDRRSFSFDGSSLRIAETTLRSEGRVVSEDWHGVLRFGPSRLSLVPPVIGMAELELEMTDARPFLTFFAERRPRLEAVARLLRVRDIVGSTDLVLDGGSIFFDRLELESHRLLAEGRLCLQPERRQGALYAKSLGIGLAASFEDRDRRWTLLRPRRWYRERAEAIRCEGAALAAPSTSAVP